MLPLADHGDNAANGGMRRQRIIGMRQHSFAADPAILLGYVAAGPFSTAGRDDQADDIDPLRHGDAP